MFMWHAYPDTNDNLPRVIPAKLMLQRFKPGDVVRICLCTLHILDDTGLSIEPEHDEHFFIGHGMVVKELNTDETSDLYQDCELPLYSVLLFGSYSPAEFFNYELDPIDILDIKEPETHFLDYIADNNGP
jgi:hypothetical protein